MDRTIKNIREKRFSEKHKYERLNYPLDIAISDVTYIDEDGEIKTAVKETVVDTREMLKDVNPVTTRIEYMQQYGTLQDGKIVKYNFGRSTIDMNEVQIEEHVKSIIRSNFKDKE